MVNDNLASLYKEMEENYEDFPLVSIPTDIIPGEGDHQARIMLIGEAPGYHEHVARRPFVGRSGQFLRKTLLEVNLPPETVYISNIVKARPPDNRDPSPAEILAYKPFLDQEIQIISPELIITLGRFSMAKFLPDVFISGVHGRLHRVKWSGRQIYVLPMYHPAAALRATRVKDSFVNDFLKVPKILKYIDEHKGAEQLAESVAEALL